jgi:hypothetical protein
VLLQARAPGGIGNYQVETIGTISTNSYTIDLNATLATGDNMQFWLLAVE